MTERIYETDPYCREFEAEVTACEAAEKGYRIALNRTAFFPEGGGQPGDRGQIGNATVTDTREIDGEIWHMTPFPLEKGQTFTGQLDWDFRYSNMQNHAGEHIVSGLIHRMYGYDNVGFHMGSQAITIDMNGELSWEQLKEVEMRANRAIMENIPIQVLLPDEKELTTLDYRSKKEIDGQVRLIRIPGYDCCACCGTHPEKTGEIHLIKLLSIQNYKKGVRISLLCGSRALEDYRSKHQQLLYMSHLLSAKIEEVDKAVGRLEEENGRLKYERVAARKEILQLKAEKQLQDMPEDSERICVIESGLEGSEPREFADVLAGSGRSILVLALPEEGQGPSMRYVLIDPKKGAREWGKALNAAFDGRGGGSPDMVQGTCCGDAEKIKEWFEVAR